MTNHIPHKVKSAVVVTPNAPFLLDSTIVINFYPQLSKFNANLSNAVVLCQMMYLLSNKMVMLNGHEYKYRLEQLRRVHFPWLGAKQISRILAKLEERLWITIDSKLGSKNGYTIHPNGAKVYKEYLKEKKKPFIGVYPALVAALIPEKAKGASIASYDPNGYGATALLQCIILSRLHRLVGTTEDKTIVRSHIELYTTFFNFVSYPTYFTAMKALVHRGLLMQSTVAEVGIEDAEQNSNCSVYQIDYDLLQKQYMPLIKPLAYNLTNDKCQYADTYSKDVNNGEPFEYIK